MVARRGCAQADLPRLRGLEAFVYPDPALTPWAKLCRASGAGGCVGAFSVGICGGPVARPFRGEAFRNAGGIALVAMENLKPEGLSYSAWQSPRI